MLYLLKYILITSAGAVIKKDDYIFKAIFTKKETNDIISSMRNVISDVVIDTNDNNGIAKYLNELI